MRFINRDKCLFYSIKARETELTSNAKITLDRIKKGEKFTI